MTDATEDGKTKTPTVMTASEFKAKVRAGKTPRLHEIDVVTCATFGIMSGTSAVISFSVAPPGSFTKVLSMTLNGVDTNIGPCPNERNGHVDCVVFGTSVSKENSRYGGGHLFRDIAARNPIHAKIKTDVGIIEKTVTIDDMSCARLVVTRGAFKNYTAFVNPSNGPIETIFSVTTMPENFAGATFSGCGEINPLENDPELSHHKQGKSVLVNGAKGILLGTGTRSSIEKPNMSVVADIRDMNPDLMGGFSYPTGAECLTSIATAIPVKDEKTLLNLCILDEDIPLPVADVTTRIPFTTSNYADAWSGDSRIVTNPKNCTQLCVSCAKDLCPMMAITEEKTINNSCMGCFTCVGACLNGVFTSNTGELLLSENVYSKTNGSITDRKTIPIILRQSDRVRGEKAAEILKHHIQYGNWGEI